MHPAIAMVPWSERAAASALARAQWPRPIIVRRERVTQINVAMRMSSTSAEVFPFTLMGSSRGLFELSERSFGSSGRERPSRRDGVVVGTLADVPQSIIRVHRSINCLHHSLRYAVQADAHPSHETDELSRRPFVSSSRTVLSVDCPVMPVSWTVVSASHRSSHPSTSWIPRCESRCRPSAA
jgi:hypothetical protein